MMVLDLFPSVSALEEQTPVHAPQSTHLSISIDILDTIKPPLRYLTKSHLEKLLWVPAV